MENSYTYFLGIPHELIFEIFGYINQKNDAESFQDVIHFSGINIDYEKLFMYEFSKDYAFLRPVIVYDRSLYKYLNWRELYIDHKSTVWKRLLPNFELVPLHIYRDSISTVSSSTLNIVYCAHLFNDYKGVYHALEYFKTVNLNSYITPWILHNSIFNEDFGEAMKQVKDLIRHGTNELKEAAIAGDLIEDSLIIRIFILFFEERIRKDAERIITLEIVKVVENLYNTYIDEMYPENRNADIESYYHNILHYLKMNVNKNIVD